MSKSGVPIVCLRIFSFLIKSNYYDLIPSINSSFLIFKLRAFLLDESIGKRPFSKICLNLIQS